MDWLSKHLMKFFYPIACLTIGLNLASCVQTSTVSNGPTAAAPLTMASFPRVISGGWRCTTTAPTASLSGLPSVRYRSITNPKDSLEIINEGDKPNWIKTDEPEFLTIMGQNVPSYGSGNEVVAIATQPLLLTPPGGKTSYYTFEFTGDHIYRTRKIPQFGW